MTFHKEGTRIISDHRRDLITELAIEHQDHDAFKEALKSRWPEVLQCLKARGWATETIEMLKAETHGETL